MGNLSIRFKTLFAIVCMFFMLLILFAATYIFTAESLKLLNRSSLQTFPILETFDKAIADSENLSSAYANAAATNDAFALEDAEVLKLAMQEKFQAIKELDSATSTEIDEISNELDGSFERAASLVSEIIESGGFGSLESELAEQIEGHARFTQGLRDYRESIRQQYVDDIESTTNSSRQLTSIGLALLVVGVVIGFLINLYLQRSIVLPVKRITDASLEVGKGEYVRVEAHPGGDEIAHLTENFNQMVDSLERNMRELEEKERARTLFFHNTSHELRTPLNGILGYLNLVRQGRYGDLSSKAYKQLTKAYNLVEGLKFQVNLILDLAKAKRGELDANYQDFSLSSLKRDVDNLGEGLTLKGHGYSFESIVELGDDRFVGDRKQLMTIIRNILGNAFKFKDPNRDNHVVFSMKKENEYLHLSISDSGIGIPDSYKEKIFEEFTQVQGDASRNYEGTGLGLSMVRDLVRVMGGEITLESKEGEGSTFGIKIANRPECSAVQVDSSSEEEFSHDLERNLEIDSKAEQPVELSITPYDPFWKVMIIDDNVNNCDVFKEILEVDGYTLNYALSGKSGLKLMRENPPHLLLLDMMMPEMSGEDVIAEMKSDPRLRMVPVILITARASEEDRIYGLNIGADDYLPKPVVANELRLRVKNYIERQKLALEVAESAKKVSQEQDLRKSLESEVKSTSEQLIQAEKMVLLGQLVAGVAHDMASPSQLIGNAGYEAKDALNEVSSRFFALLGEDDDPETNEVKRIFSQNFDRINNSLKEIDLGCTRMNDIQLAIRNQSRLDANQDEFNVAEMLRESAIILNSKLKTWKLEMDVDKDLTLHARRSQIGQVISNLLSNAADALEEHKTKVNSDIHILLGYEIITREDSEFLVLTVEDAGPGVSEEDKKKIFEAFYTSKALGHGTGLGLSICSKIVNSHGGSIEVDTSKRLGGACFKVILPTSKNQQKAS